MISFIPFGSLLHFVFHKRSRWQIPTSVYRKRKANRIIQSSVELDVELITENHPFTCRTEVLYSPQPASSQKAGEILLPCSYTSRQHSFSVLHKKCLETDGSTRSIYRSYMVNICQQELHFRVSALLPLTLKKLSHTYMDL